MRIDVQSSDVSISKRLRSYLESLVLHRMQLVKEHVQSVSVTVKDNNGPKGGNDKECIVEAVIPNQPNLVVKKRSSDVVASIKKATDRIARVANRQIKKQRRREQSIRRLEAPAV